MRRITSMHIADLMLEENRYMSIPEIMELARQRYSELEITRCQVTNITKWFVNSKYASCDFKSDSYPRLYKLYYFHNYTFKPRGGNSKSFRRYTQSELICSLEISALMLRERRFLTITELTALAKREFPMFRVERGQVMNIVRALASSNKALCEVNSDAYPHKYFLRSINGYKFKVRNRHKHFDIHNLQVPNKATSEALEKERQLLSNLAKSIMDDSARRRGATRGR